MKQLAKHCSILMLAAAMGLMSATAVMASGDLPALLAKYSPENQFPAEPNCHVPSIKGTTELEDVSVYVERRRKAASKKGYVRTEHEFEIPRIPMVTMSGDKTDLAEQLDTDKPVMLNFIFTTCTTICPVLTASFYQLQNELGDESRDIRMISISIDPEYDTPEKLKSYAERFNAGPQWQFLTGETKNIVSAERVFGAYRGAKMNHDPLTFIRADKSEPWVRINGIASAEDIINEYRNLIAD